MTTAEPRSDGLTKWLVAAPNNVSILLAVVALLWAIPTVYFGPGVIRNLSADSKPAEKSKTGADATKEDKDAEKKSPLAAFDPDRTNRTIAFVLGLGGMLACGLFAFTWTAGYPTTPVTQRPFRARIFVLAAAMTTGLLLMAGGAWFAIDQFDALKKWIDTKSAKNLWKALAPVMAFVVGAAIAFAGAQYARIDERHNQTTRRLVYATNFLVSALLLFLVLVIVNIFFGARLPNKLDTTSSGFFSLDPSTEKYIRELNQKVTVHANIGSDEPQYAAVRAMLATCQELNPNLFVPQYIGSNADLQKLRTKFPTVNLRESALVLELGDDGTRFGAVKHADLAKAAPGSPRQFFQGESEMMRELLFLSENRTKPTIYFTQNSGELAIEPSPMGGSNPERSATALKAHLEKANLIVKPLPFDKKNPKIPDDAALVVVLDPAVPLPDEMVGALRKYMTEKGPNNKAGRLFVVAGPTPKIQDEGLQTTGLEALLSEFNVGLVPAYLYMYANFREPADGCIVDTQAGRTANNPIVQTISTRPFELTGPNRQLTVVQPGNAAFRATAIIQTTSVLPVLTWLEKSKLADINATVKALAKSEDLQRSRMLTEEPRALAVAVSEGETGRLVVFGTSTIFTDAHAQQGRAGAGSLLLSSSIDWLRERPTVSIVNKEIGYWKIPTQLDAANAVYLPLGIMVLSIIVVAVGVWVVRRS